MTPDTDTIIGLALTAVAIAALIGLLSWGHRRSREIGQPCDGANCPDGICICGEWE